MTTEQQYRVIADRDKGDDPTVDQITVGDRYTMQAEAGAVFTDQVIRIERPVPTTEVWSESRMEYVPMPQQTSPHPPTREQIESTVDGAIGKWWDDGALLAALRPTVLSAILALIQNGAEQ